MTHYIEIVTEEADAHCATLGAVHGLTFGDPVADLGFARVAKSHNGTLIGVRQPLAAHETPIVRTYLAVDDIQAALHAAEASGAVIAYGPAQQGETGTWAITIQGGVQMGLWQTGADAL